MSFYNGSTRDGSDMREFKGMYVSPCGEYWSSQPITDEQKSQDRKEQYHTRMHNNINELSILGSFLDEYKLILAKTSTLPRSLRDYLVEWFKDTQYAG